MFRLYSYYNQAWSCVPCKFPSMNLFFKVESVGSCRFQIHLCIVACVMSCEKIWPRLRGLPGLVDRATRLGWSPHLSCKRDQLKWEILRTGGLSHLTGLPHLPGVPHLHVNKPSIKYLPAQFPTSLETQGQLVGSGNFYFLLSSPETKELPMSWKNVWVTISKSCWICPENIPFLTDDN